MTERHEVLREARWKLSVNDELHDSVDELRGSNVVAVGPVSPDVEGGECSLCFGVLSVVVVEVADEGQVMGGAVAEPVVLGAESGS